MSPSRSARRVVRFAHFVRLARRVALACCLAALVPLYPEDARLLQDLKVQPHERVLEIGAGSGFMAALLARTAKHVVTLEIEPELAEMARTNLARAGYGNVEVRLGDGSTGAIPDGPFDVIVLSGSVAEAPQHLLARLRDGGRLSAFVGQEPVMRTTIVYRTGPSFAATQPWDTDTARLRNFPEPSRFRF